MSLSSASVPIGATWAPTGGSATSLVSLGSNPGENKLFIDDGSGLILRKTILATSKPPVASASAPNGYTQQRTAVVLHFPLLLDNGSYTTNTLKVEIAFDPETTAAEIASMREWLSFLGDETDFDDLFNEGSTA